MDPQQQLDPERLALLIQQRAWVPLAVPVIWIAIRFLKSDTKYFPTIPADYRIWAVFILGALSGVIEHVVKDGQTWTTSLVGGLISALGALTFQETAIASIRGGKEFPVPKFLIKPDTSPAPNAPVTLPAMEPPPAVELKPLELDTTPPPVSAEDTNDPPNNVD